MLVYIVDGALPLTLEWSGCDRGAGGSPAGARGFCARCPLSGRGNGIPGSCARVALPRDCAGGVGPARQTRSGKWNVLFTGRSSHTPDTN